MMKRKQEKRAYVVRASEKIKVISLSSYVRYDERENTNETKRNDEY